MAEQSNLQKLMEFPTDYMFKIMGKSDLLDIDFIVKQMENILSKKIGENFITKKESGKQKYTSYTVKTHLEQYNQLEKIYESFKLNKTIMYYL